MFLFLVLTFTHSFSFSIPFYFWPIRLTVNFHLHTHTPDTHTGTQAHKLNGNIQKRKHIIFTPSPPSRSLFIKIEKEICLYVTKAENRWKQNNRSRKEIFKQKSALCPKRKWMKWNEMNGRGGIKINTSIVRYYEVARKYLKSIHLSYG